MAVAGAGLPRGVEAVSLLATNALVLQYKSTPGKKVSVVGWMVQLPDDPEHPDIFQLNNPDKGRRGRSRAPAAAPCPVSPSARRTLWNSGNICGPWFLLAFDSDVHGVPSLVHKSCAHRAPCVLWAVCMACAHRDPFCGLTCGSRSPSPPEP